MVRSLQEFKKLQLLLPSRPGAWESQSWIAQDPSPAKVDTLMPQLQHKTIPHHQPLSAIRTLQLRATGHPEVPGTRYFLEHDTFHAKIGQAHGPGLPSPWSSSGPPKVLDSISGHWVLTQLESVPMCCLSHPASRTEYVPHAGSLAPWGSTAK